MKTTLMALVALTMISGTAHAVVKTTNSASISTSPSDDPNIAESVAGKKFTAEKAQTDCARRTNRAAHQQAINLSGASQQKNKVNSSNGNAAL
jgi:hypothetical protein